MFEQNPGGGMGNRNEIEPMNLERTAPLHPAVLNGNERIDLSGGNAPATENVVSHEHAVDINNLPLTQYVAPEAIRVHQGEFFIANSHMQLAIEAGIIDLKNPNVKLIATGKRRYKDPKSGEEIDALVDPSAVVTFDVIENALQQSIAEDEQRIREREQNMIGLMHNDAVPMRYREAARIMLEEFKKQDTDFYSNLQSSKIFQLLLAELRTNLTVPLGILSLKRNRISTKGLVPRENTVFFSALEIALRAVENFPDLQKRAMFIHGSETQSDIFSLLQRAQTVVRSLRMKDKREPRPQPQPSM